MKKIISMFLALVMALALAVPAFASSGTVDVPGTVNLPTINVVLPTTASMIMNPYQLEVKLNPKDTTETAKTDQIITPLMTVKNLSNIGVQVGVTVKGTIGKTSNATFAAADVTPATETSKTAFIYAKFLKGDPDMAIGDIGKETTAPTADTATITIVTADADGSFPTAFDPDATQAAANTLTGTTDSKNAADGGVLGFRLFGSMANAPEKAGTAAGTTVADPWTDKDAMSVSFSFTFTPVASSLPVDPTT